MYGRRNEGIGAKEQLAVRVPGSGAQERVWGQKLGFGGCEESGSGWIRLRTKTKDQNLKASVLESEFKVWEPGFMVGGQDSE